MYPRDIKLVLIPETHAHSLTNSVYHSEMNIIRASRKSDWKGDRERTAREKCEEKHTGQEHQRHSWEI
jgi:hypothetical protein